jgi:hypothetical protein
MRQMGVDQRNHRGQRTDRDRDQTANRDRVITHLPARPSFRWPLRCCTSNHRHHWPQLGRRLALQLLAALFALVDAYADRYLLVVVFAVEASDVRRFAGRRRCMGRLGFGRVLTALDVAPTNATADCHERHSEPRDVHRDPVSRLKARLRSVDFAIGFDRVESV